MTTRTLARITVVAAALASSPFVAAAAVPHSLNVSAKLTVTGGPPPACHASICTIRNHGTGQLTHFGKITFTTVITADGNQPPCGTSSQWVNRIVRTIHTKKGVLVLHEAGLQCPHPGFGFRVDAIWSVDSADSTGVFAGAHGRGNDTAFPMQGTAATHGTITLKP